jgi:hypothetical protein
MQFDVADHLPGGCPQRAVSTILAITPQEAEARFRSERVHIGLVSEVWRVREFVQRMDGDHEAPRPCHEAR